MSNAMREVRVPIMLDKERTLVFNLNSFIELEEMYGTYKAAMGALGTGSLKSIRAFLWAGLVHEDKSLTLEDVGTIFTRLDPETINEVADKILRSASGNLPDSKN